MIKRRIQLLTLPPCPLMKHTHTHMCTPQAKQRLQGAGLHPPLLVKPLWTDGREGSHGLAVLHDIGVARE